MNISIFHIEHMDCPSEVQLIRIAFADDKTVASIEADVADRELVVVHSGSVDRIVHSLRSLHLGAELRSTAEHGDETITSDRDQRALLKLVLLINAGLFLAEMLAGILASSMGLLADSLDMLADAFVYGIGLYAVGGTTARKKRIARIGGGLQLALAILGFVEVLHRFLGTEEMPDVKTMILLSVIALIGNAACLYLLQRSRSNEPHMLASMIFTSNDVIANIGVTAAALLVSAFQSSIPDLVVGALVFALITYGAFRILRIAR